MYNMSFGLPEDEAARNHVASNPIEVFFSAWSDILSQNCTAVVVLAAAAAAVYCCCFFLLNLCLETFTSPVFRSCSHKVNKTPFFLSLLIRDHSEKNKVLLETSQAK